ncbi:MAG: GH32 C-terminal domain-containing protein, partial [Eubacterium sp.]|nr:GH32 C-terminal domain-containing protein [Eubacterium sp.]
ILFLKEKDVLDVHILSDQSSLELFTDNYQNNHSMNVFAGNEQNKIYFQAVEGSVVLENVEVYGIEP